MRRILHIIDSLDYTGTASQLLVLSRRLSQCGHEVHVCALNSGAPRLEEFEAANLNIKTVPRRWKVDPLADWQLRRHIRKLRPDVVHTWDSLPGITGAAAAGCSIVAGHYRIRRWKPSWDWAVERRCERHAKAHVTSDDSVRDWCVAHGMTGDGFAIVPGGVEPAAASDHSREALLQELNLPAAAKLIGVVARLVPEKCVKDLIWAADLLRVLHDNLRMLVIGDGPLRDTLTEYARLASDLDHIKFLGAGNDLWRILPHVDVLWDGSENTGQSSAILEAMAAGVPVVASDTAANRAIVVENETGFLIPLGTRAWRAARARCTDRIFNDSALAARLGTAARSRVAERFSGERMAQDYEKLYEATVKRG
jgi:glycosyltransferase involved in cell wall biosynthesis